MTLHPLKALTRALERWAYLHPQAPALTPHSPSQDIPAPVYVNRSAPMAITMHTTSETGSVSHGTMREVDLIPAFLAALRNLDPQQASLYERQAAEVVALLSGGTDSGDVMDTAGDILADLFDDLDQYSPDGYYFGGHPGDAADYGWWPREDLG